MAELTWAMAAARWCGHAMGDPAVVQLPFTADAPWIGGTFGDALASGEWLSLVVLDAAATAGPLQAGLLLDDWTETVPVARETTGVAFNFNRPNAIAPQALLVAVAPRPAGTGHGTTSWAACTRRSISRSSARSSRTPWWADARTNAHPSAATSRCCRRFFRSSPQGRLPTTDFGVLGTEAVQHEADNVMPIAERAARVYNLTLTPRATSRWCAAGIVSKAARAVPTSSAACARKCAIRSGS